MPESVTNLNTSAQIWIASPNDLHDQGARDSNLSLLNGEEVARYQRFHFDRDRLAYLAAHALLRRTLSRYASVEPAAWTFVTNAYGKPEIADNQAVYGLRFSLTHAKALVACIITEKRDCGIDVESMGKLRDPLTITKRFFTPREYHAVRNLPKKDQDRRFTEIWTLKEAYVKTLGLGLSASLRSAWFDIDEKNSLRVGFQNNDQTEQTCWQFFRTQPDQNHKLAAAVRCADAHLIRFQLHRLDLETQAM